MPYTKEEGGLLNNFAVEPKVYQAQAPSKKEQRNYLLMGVGAAILVSSLIYVAVTASNVG